MTPADRRAALLGLAWFAAMILLIALLDIDLSETPLPNQEPNQ